MEDNKPKTPAEIEHARILKDIFVESGNMFGDEGHEKEQIRLLEAALMKALTERDKWKDAANRHQ